MSELNFISFKAESFAGIMHEDASAVILMDHEDGGNIVRFSGDQGVGKTSHLNAIKALLGGEMPANAVNSKSKRVAATLKFKDSAGRIITSSATKSGFTVNVEQDGAKDKVGSARGYIQKLIGPLGVSPMILKEKDGAAQVKFVRDMANLNAEALQLEQELKTKYKNDFEARRNAKREVKNVQARLSGSPFHSYDKPHDVFTPTAEYDRVMSEFNSGAGNQELIQKRFNEANEKVKNLALYNETLAGYKKQRTAKNDELARKQAEIARLTREADALVEEIEKIDVSIEKGEKMIDDSAAAPEEFRVANEALMGLNNFLTYKQQADASAELAKDYDEKTDIWKNLDAKITAWEQKKLEFIKMITPDIPGVEVRLKRDINVNEEAEIYRELNPGATLEDINEYVNNLKVDNEDGLFYKGRSVDQLCESELWELCLEMWRHMGVKVVFIENINALGSEAVDRLNVFAKYGKVFCSEMDRTEKELKVSFHDEIPNS